MKSQTVSFKDLKKQPLQHFRENGIVVLSANFQESLDSEAWKNYLNYLPHELAYKVERYKKWEDRHNSLFGKLLIYCGYYLLSGKILDFSTLATNPFGKPFLKESEINFNISHSETTVVCAFYHDEIGMDIEAIKKINVQEFKNVFQMEEMKEIEIEGIPKFYELWTKKEAVIKLLGKGLKISLPSLDVSNEILHHEGQMIFIHCFKVKNQIWSIASRSSLKKINCFELTF